MIKYNTNFSLNISRIYSFLLHLGGHINIYTLLSAAHILYIYIYICMCVCVYTPSSVQPEDGSKKLKPVAENCKFLKYLIKKLCYTLLYYFTHAYFVQFIDPKLREITKYNKTQKHLSVLRTECYTTFIMYCS